MTLETIRDIWLVPAHDHRELQRQDLRRTRRNRLPLGEKGVGRFAVHKLGDHIELITRAKGSSERFQNYRAVFTVLDEAVISREWVHHVGKGQQADKLAPVAWKRWVENGTYQPLVAPRSKPLRSRVEQLPTTIDDKKLITEIYQRYATDAFGFEWCAAELVKLLLPEVSRLDLTRPYRDGGRDGIGTVRLGQGQASLDVSFALEAKCYGAQNSVGVRELSRLISRIKYREFGVLVTTSYVHDHAYREVVDDGHPVILVTAIDIATLVRRAGYSTPALVRRWLDSIDVLRLA
jgi:hypothetical protein